MQLKASCSLPQPVTSSHPPSLRHVRLVLLPLLGSFFALDVDKYPTHQEWKSVTDALEIVFGASGGRAFFGEAGQAELFEAIALFWREFEEIDEQKMSIDDP